MKAGKKRTASIPTPAPTPAGTDLLGPVETLINDHSARHENGGADKISVAGLSGVLADPQTPAAHTHNAADITAGTLPDARFPATLPAISGANLTNLDASDLATGTVPNARMGGVSGTFITADSPAKTVTVTNGVITAIV